MDKLKPLSDLRKIILKLRISGPITSNSLQEVKQTLSPFYISKPVALAVVINSTGGSAVQSNLIRKEIKHFSQKYNIKTFSFAEDYAGSGAYLILTAGNEVYSSNSSLVGCIGSSINLFEFKDLAEHYGIKRRQWTTTPKDLPSMLDPLSPLTEDAKAWVRSTLESTTGELKNLVVTARGQKLKDTALTGEYFNSEEAKSNGLVDGVGNCEEVMGKLFPGTRIVEFKKKRFGRM